MSKTSLCALLAAALCSTLATPGTGSSALAATFVVDDVADLPDLAPGDAVCATAGGTCTLRAAIDEANASPNGDGMDAIHFAVPGEGPHVIAPVSALPAITEAVVIDGFTQPGSLPNASTTGMDAVMLVVVSGANAGPADGLDVLADGVVLRGLVVSGWARLEPGQAGNGIRLRGASAVVEGCVLGMDATGTVAVENGTAGVRIDGANARIGGTIPAARNLVSGNVVMGIEILASGARVLGNVIGSDATGTVRMRNGRGIHVRGPGAEIGDASGLPNLVSGNGSFGIEVTPEGSGTRIVGNWVGVSGTGTGELGNGSDGILVVGAEDVHVEGNVVAASGRHGIQLDGAPRTVVSGNLVGTDPSGRERFGNGADGIVADAPGGTIGPANVVAHSSQDGVIVPGVDSGPVYVLGNAIFDNNRSAIDLDGDGLTPNDPLDEDAGANGLQNFPDLASASSDGITTVVNGTLSSAPERVYRIEVFANAECDLHGHGEAERFLGSFDVATDAGGTAAFDAALDAPVVGGTLVTATATSADGTSEVSACLLASGPATTTTTTTQPPTTTNTPSSTTTTTTVPRACTTDAECADTDACTLDGCIAGGCARPRIAGIAGVTCHVTNLRSMLDGVVCSGCSCRFVRRLDRVERSLLTADTTSRSRGCRRGLRGARRRARTFARKTNKATRSSCLGPPARALDVVGESAALATAAEILSPAEACRR